MNIYVVGPSQRGPCKIGIAQNPKKRLRALQTGNQLPLNIYHIEPVGTFAKKAERVAHELLRNKRSPAGNEWFDETADNAKLVVQRAAKIAGVSLTDTTRTFSELQTRLTLEWLSQKARFEEENDYCEDFGGRHPDMLKLWAATLKERTRARHTFNDYILSWDEGAWLRWAFERMNRRFPSGRALDPYLDADEFLESQKATCGRKVVSRWIEWALGGRDLRTSEIQALSEIWNKYVPAHNRVFDGPEHDMHGEDDHVDDVYVYVLKGDRERGDKDKIVFSHNAFRAVLVPKRRIELVGYQQSIFGRLLPLGAVEMQGFVAPLMPDDIWERMFHSWTEYAQRNQEKAFHAFLERTDKRYPKIKRREKIPPASRAWRSLPCIDEFGMF